MNPAFLGAYPSPFPFAYVWTCERFSSFVLGYTLNQYGDLQPRLFEGQQVEQLAMSTVGFAFSLRLDVEPIPGINEVDIEVEGFPDLLTFTIASGIYSLNDQALSDYLAGLVPVIGNQVVLGVNLTGRA